MDESRGESKRAIYDREIAPLMERIAKICDARGIPVYANFALDGNQGSVCYGFPPAATIPESDRPAAMDWFKRHHPLALATGVCDELPLVIPRVLPRAPKAAS